jgi:hypothetical protein
MMDGSSAISAGASVVFPFLRPVLRSDRLYERNSILIMTERAFKDWSEVFLTLAASAERAISGESKMKGDDDRYVKKLLDLYLGLPQTPSRVSRDDRRLAQQLCQQQTPLETVESAFLLATARRSFRDPALPPLQPIRSLHYFLPVIEELLATGVSSDYAQYLRRKLAPLLNRNAVSK